MADIILDFHDIVDIQPWKWVNRGLRNQVDGGYKSTGPQRWQGWIEHVVKIRRHFEITEGWLGQARVLPGRSVEFPVKFQVVERST